jgi:formylglycine-generating enzyme required for sulfatase activity
MKTAPLVRLFCALCSPIWVVAPLATAQTLPQLDIQLYAGLSITGVVDTVYSIQYTTNLTQTNAWRCLTFLQLPSTTYLWTETSTPATGRRFYRAVALAPTNLVFIPPGTFRMGSPTNEVDRLDDEGPQTAITISRGFWMGKYLVTQGEYQALMGSNPSYFNGDRSGDSPPFNHDYGTDLARPVERVSWEDATNYCGLLTRQERAAGRIPNNSVYRLPTESEWEYTCRAWTSTRFFYGDDPGYLDLTNYAWFGDFSSGGGTHPVGQKLPNPWGLYDMHGNVWKWCLDWYGPYLGGIAIDPQGPATGQNHVVRGGGWGGSGDNCRSARRGNDCFAPNGAVQGCTIGFQVVLAPVEP